MKELEWWPNTGGWSTPAGGRGARLLAHDPPASPLGAVTRTLSGHDTHQAGRVKIRPHVPKPSCVEFLSLDLEEYRGRNRQYR
jgi:hypothetical protein